MIKYLISDTNFHALFEYKLLILNKIEVKNIKLLSSGDSRDKQNNMRVNVINHLNYK